MGQLFEGKDQMAYHKEHEETHRLVETDVAARTQKNVWYAQKKIEREVTQAREHRKEGAHFREMQEKYADRQSGIDAFCGKPQTRDQIVNQRSVEINDANEQNIFSYHHEKKKRAEEELEGKVREVARPREIDVLRARRAPEED